MKCFSDENTSFYHSETFQLHFIRKENIFNKNGVLCFLVLLVIIIFLLLLLFVCEHRITCAQFFCIFLFHQLENKQNIDTEFIDLFFQATLLLEEK